MYLRTQKVELFLIIAISFLGGAPALAGGQSAVALHTGDINNDGHYTTADVNCYLASSNSFAKNLPKPDCQAYPNEYADMNCDGKINKADATLAFYHAQLEKYAKSPKKSLYVSALNNLKKVSHNLLLVHDACQPPSLNNTAHYSKIAGPNNFSTEEIGKLSNPDQETVAAWDKVSLNKFVCKKLKTTEINFVFIPLGFNFDDPTEETIKNFSLHSKWTLHSIIQHEPFTSYAGKIKGWVYLPTVKAKGYAPLAGKDQVADQAQSLNNETSLVAQEQFAAYELKLICPKLGDSSVASSLYPDVVYVFVSNNLTTFPVSTDADVKSKYFTGSVADNGVVEGVVGFGAYASFDKGSIYMPSEGYQALINPYRHYSYFEHPNTPTHELGHAYGGFLDEYSPYDLVDDGNPQAPYAEDSFLPAVRYSDSKAPTCLFLEQAEKSWNDLITDQKNQTANPETKLGYYLGCGHRKNRYRSSNSSIMSQGDAFDMVQERHLCKTLSKNTAETLGVCLEY